MSDAEAHRNFRAWSNPDIVAESLNVAEVAQPAILWGIQTGGLYALLTEQGARSVQ